MSQKHVALHVINEYNIYNIYIIISVQLQEAELISVLRMLTGTEHFMQMSSGLTSQAAKQGLAEHLSGFTVSDLLRFPACWTEAHTQTEQGELAQSVDVCVCVCWLLYMPDQKAPKE